MKELVERNAIGWWCTCVEVDDGRMCMDLLVIIEINKREGLVN